MNLNITLDSSPDPTDVQTIERQLEAYNLRFAPADNYTPLVIFVRDPQKKLVGGLLGESYWGWLHIRILWLDELCRGRGYGKKVLEVAEREAIARGCHRIHLDTMSFQSVQFYERHGFVTFGVLHDLPPGHSRHYMMKSLDPATG